MSYKVIHYFEDLQDSRHPYKVGDIFPRRGMEVSEVRLEELAGKYNRQGKPLIELIKEEPAKNEVLKQIVEEVNQYTKTDINRMSTAELQELASKEGVAGADEMTGSDLKKLLIEKFGL